MGLSLTDKILKAHLAKGELKPGEEIAIKIDRTLTQDATGTMAYLQFEAIGVPSVRTDLSVSFIDHNTLQTGFENADDHKFLQTVAAKYGIYYSKAGNGICHQVNLERFGVPGKTLLGSDSHTPTAGGVGMIAIGAGGLDVAVAMGGGAFYMTAPKVVLVKLSGKLSEWVSAKDVILELLKRLTVKGGVGKIFEYGGEGVKTLTVPERAVITNMGAELGATTSIFPSDEKTLEFLKAEGRIDDYAPLAADEGAAYDEVIEIDLSSLIPLTAKPHMPDQVAKVSELKDIKVDQVAIGSCTNSSYVDLMTVASVLKGKKVHPDVSLVISPGSKQVYEMIAKNGALADLIASGARILESTCGPCIGMGQAPRSGAVSLRTFNRNFEGRSGTKDAKIYLVSVQTAAASALTGYITDPRTMGKAPDIKMPEKFDIDDSMILPPSTNPDEVEVYRGPNIKPLPVQQKLPESLTGKVLLKVGDNITTDHIMPAGSKILPLRSNIPAISKYVFESVDAAFSERALKEKGGFVIGGENYGQGSSREHAALAPMYLGVKAVIAKSFARIHFANLINFGILPLIFENPSDYDKIGQGDELYAPNILKELGEHKPVTFINKTKNNEEYKFKYNLTGRQVKIIKEGGLLNETKNSN
ncbi:MAG: aconitate hydratase [Candidatus Acidulodesulfobacterium ferriphilum]|uniref:Aconitate hydratase n=1 Tax=Candidatus Acidulodesulfobacterium ferriphilum TaxID=2597223 RepID=A0A519BAY7_9DELT|nr:MAG: aconitate hydratase [Candidatus Acidulodesulfobacterium ferriphilum]